MVVNNINTIKNKTNYSFNNCQEFLIIKVNAII